MEKRIKSKGDFVGCTDEYRAFNEELVKRSLLPQEFENKKIERKDNENEEEILRRKIHEYFDLEIPCIFLPFLKGEEWYDEEMYDDYYYSDDNDPSYMEDVLKKFIDEEGLVERCVLEVLKDEIIAKEKNGITIYEDGIEHNDRLFLYFEYFTPKSRQQNNHGRRCFVGEAIKICVNEDGYRGVVLRGYEAYPPEFPYEWYSETQDIIFRNISWGVSMIRNRHLRNQVYELLLKKNSKRGRTIR